MPEKVYVILSNKTAFEGYRSTLRAILERGYLHSKEDIVTWAVDFN